VKKLQIFEGNVQLVKGTLIIRAERIVVSQDDDGYQRGVATGSGGAWRASGRSAKGLDEYIEGEAERIEHDAKAEKTEFFMRAWVKSGLDEVRGQYISYDALNEQYVVTSGPNGTRAQPGSGERVRAVIQPKNKKEDAPATPPKGKPGSTAPPRPAAPVPALKSAQDIANPRQETPK
jgi:lipopolysaccharide export system protein LptA